MVSIPPILLRKLYVPKSLANGQGWFVFELRNQIATGTVLGVSRLIVDDQERGLEGVAVATGGETRAAPSISADTPLAFAVGAGLRFRVLGTLAAGEHTIEVTVQTQEAGPLTVSFRDTVL